MQFVAELSVPASQLCAGPFNPRIHFDLESLQNLAATIKPLGLAQPILVRARPGDVPYEIIAGERRWRAGQLNGPKFLLSIRVVEASDDEAAVLAMTENTDREPLSPLEQALGAEKLLKRFNNDRAEVCARLGWSPKLLDRRLALTQCIEVVRNALMVGTILVGHAELLAAIPPQNQETALSRIIEGRLSVHDVKKKLLDLSQRLETAIFDKTECADCSFNSSRQTTLFQEAIVAGHCTNATCFGKKTDDALAQQVMALEQDYHRVHITVPNDPIVPTKLVVDGPLGVGAEQARACRNCANFGCTVSKHPGTTGTVTQDLCFDADCNAGKVAARVAAEAPPAPTGVPPLADRDNDRLDTPAEQTPDNKTGKKASKSVAPTQKLKDYRTAQWRTIAAKHVVADPHCGMQVLLGLGLADQANAVSHLKMVTAIEKITKRKPAIGSLPKSLQFIADTPPEDYPRIVAVMAASAMFDIGVDALPQIMRFTGLDLGEYWRVNADYLNLLTRGEIERCAREIGLAKHLGAAMQQIVKMKKPDMIAALLKAKGFEFAGKVPANMRYLAKP
jgi:ParB family transcriptional regulator, chromosome partitioning protein